MRGCTQGDVDSPIVFNIIMDAVLRCFLSHSDYTDTICIFYADDGLLINYNPHKLQHDLNLILTLFVKLGLHANEEKTKFMVIRGPRAPSGFCQDVYNKRYDGDSTTKGKAWRKQLTQCEICRKVITNCET